MPLESAIPSVSMKRNWLKRESIQDALRFLGLPAVMDGTHVVMTGVDEVAEWLAMTADDGLARVLGHSAHPKWAEAFEGYKKAAGPVVVRHMVSPGVSFAGPIGRLDGLGMAVRMVQSTVNDGPEAYIVPVPRVSGLHGTEWNDSVALVPRSHLDRWMSVCAAVSQAQRTLQAGAGVLMMYNGPDVKIQQASLDRLVVEKSVADGFIADIQAFLGRRDWYARRGLPWTRRYVLNGPPGTGKTSLARWAATNLGLPAYGFDFGDRYVDGTDLARFFTRAGRNAPAVAVLDDLDKVLVGDSNRSGVTQQHILTTLSGMGSMDGVIVVATSNAREAFTGPMRRRFDSIIEVPLPSRESRESYARMTFTGEELDAAITSGFVSKTEGWSYDDLRAAVCAAANAAFSRRSDQLSIEDFTRGIRTVSDSRDGGR